MKNFFNYKFSFSLLLLALLAGESIYDLIVDFSKHNVIAIENNHLPEGGFIKAANYLEMFFYGVPEKIKVGASYILGYTPFDKVIYFIILLLLSIFFYKSYKKDFVLKLNLNLLRIIQLILFIQFLFKWFVLKLIFRFFLYSDQKLDVHYYSTIPTVFAMILCSLLIEIINKALVLQEENDLTV